MESTLAVRGHKRTQAQTSCRLKRARVVTPFTKGRHRHRGRSVRRLTVQVKATDVEHVVDRDARLARLEDWRKAIHRTQTLFDTLQIAVAHGAVGVKPTEFFGVFTKHLRIYGLF